MKEYEENSKQALCLNFLGFIKNRLCLKFYPLRLDSYHRSFNLTLEIVI